MTRTDTNDARGLAPAMPIAVLLLAFASGCIQHSVQSAPIEIKPIHITMDINLRVQRELDEFFDFESKPAPADAGATATTTEPGKE